MKLTRKLRSLCRPGRNAAHLAAAAGAVSPRRGSVLVLVLGALALISVVTLIYVTVGKGDIRTATGTVDRSRVDSTVDEVKGYLNDIISRGTVATFVDGVDGGVPITIRKAWDYPFVDPYRRSITNNAVQAFNPTGSFADIGPDTRLPYQPWLSTNGPTDFMATGVQQGQPLDPLTLLDWGSISNFAPDGRFVNLWNLAPIVNGQRVSRFDAFSVRPGSNGTPNAPTASFAEMSYGVTTLDDNGRSYNAGASQLPGGGAAQPNIPAHWTMGQMRAFRLAGKDPFFGPRDYQYAGYQWCDTDGDGFYDSRWIELVNAADPDNPISVLTRDDRFRWFVAAKAIDMCGLVNVNTATDLRQPARQTGQTQASPLGLYPADIDLYRILRMDDTYQAFGFGYDQIQSPLGDFYATLHDRDFARLSGERAYNAIRSSLTFNDVLVPPPTENTGTTVNTPYNPLTGDARVQYYQLWGGQPGASYELASGASRFRLAARFGNAELLELLKFWGLNDPQVTSRLEQATDGRVNQNTGGSVNESRLGPMRSARPMEFEIGTADDAENGSQGNGVADDDALILNATTPRKHITTISHDRPLVSRIIPPANLGKLGLNELTVDAIGAAEQQGSPTQLFTGYCDALLPYSWRTGFWTNNYARYRTLNYAYNPELALRFAAHLTANFRDMYDRTDTEERKQPGAYTLLMDSSQRGNLASDQANYPWWSSNGKLDLSDARLATTSTNLTTPALNVFGIEAQPFITQVSSIVLYTDAPNSAGGDDEFNSGDDDISIRGAYSPPVATGGSGSRPTNTDFLGEVLIFQLTNPFDVDIPLSQWDHTDNYQPITDPNFTDYYLEFNGKLFKFAADLGTGGGEGIVLRKGETRNFYVLSNPIAEMQTRFNNVGGALNVPMDAVERFIDNQAALPVQPGYTYTATETTAGGARVKPILLRGMNATTGANQPYSGDLFNGAASGKKDIYLWRKLDAQAAGGGTGSRTGRATHMLADRLHDPGSPTDPTVATLDRLLTGTIEVSGTDPGPDPFPIGSPAGHDNTGFTIALWGTVKRADNPVVTPLGAIPAYCLEPRWTTGTLRNIAETDGVGVGLARSDFIGKPNADITVQSFLTKTMIPVGAPPTRPPPNNSGGFPGVFITAANSTYATLTAPAHLKRHTPHFIGANVNGTAWADLNIQIPLDNNRFRDTLGVAAPAPTISTLRVADLLLPLAIGPEFDPGPTPSAISAGQSIPTDRCLTLSEALALGLDYSNPPQTGDPFSIYHRIGDNRPIPHNALPTSGAVDRGNLNLSRFAPFEDGNADVAYQGPPGGRDIPRFPGIPMALNVLNMFSTMELQFSGINKGTPGRISINTGSLASLRTVPLLSPTTDDSTLPNSARGLAWNAFKVLSGVPGTSRVLPDLDSDIAAAVMAYRDKTLVPTRDTSNQFVITFANDQTPGEGRYETNRINAIRETLGFASVGELMAITTLGTSGSTRIRRTDQVDQLGVDSQKSGTNGTASVLYKNAAGAKVVDDITDDYQEKLVVAQAALNSVTVRSDVFAVWFVIHGYQKSDTENLDVNDPLVPSVARRFVMVLDRSNVTRAGQRAKVVLFAEVPMTP